jgi:hypothetical protein
MSASTTSRSADADNRNIVDHMAGFLAVASVALSALAFAVTPALLIPVAAILAFVAARMSDRNRGLALFAVIVSVVAFVVAMTIAVITNHALI